MYSLLCAFDFFCVFFLRSKTKKRYSKSLKSPHCRSYLCVLSAAQNTPKKRKGRRRRRDERTRWYNWRRRRHSKEVLTLSSSSSCRTRLLEKATELVKENLGIDRNERESILYSTVQRRTGAIHPGRSQGAPSRNALFTEKVRERRRKQRERKTKHISCDGNPPFFDFAKQESVDDLSQRTREKNPKFTMDVRRRFTRFYFRKPIAFRTRLFYEVFKDIEQIHGEERRN